MAYSNILDPGEYHARELSRQNISCIQFYRKQNREHFMEQLVPKAQKTVPRILKTSEFFEEVHFVPKAKKIFYLYHERRTFQCVCWNWRSNLTITWQTSMNGNKMAGQSKLPTDVIAGIGQDLQLLNSICMRPMWSSHYPELWPCLPICSP